MLSFPTSTVFERRIPKQKFYQNLDVTAEVKRLFIEQIKLITWANKLSAQTMNLAPGQTVQEIEVFRIRMAGDVLDSRVLNLMDKQIPYHLLFVLERSDGKCQLSVTYKEASQSGGSAFQLRQNYRTVWQTPEALTLNLTGLNMDALYEGIVRQIAGDALAAPKAETLQAAVEQAQAWEKLQKQIDQLKSRMRKEKQLAKQMEIRREIQRLESGVDAAYKGYTSMSFCTPNLHLRQNHVRAQSPLRLEQIYYSGALGGHPGRRGQIAGNDPAAFF